MGYHSVMNHTRLWIAAAIIALIVVLGFVLSVPHTRDVPQEQKAALATVSVPAVTLHDVYKKGVHTITGSVLASDACSSVTADAVLEGEASTTESILVRVTLADQPGICLEVPTKETFQTTMVAPANLPIGATVNGQEASTTEQ